MNQNQLLNQLKNDPGTQALLTSSDHLGNLSLMEEALLLAAAFEADGKTRIIVKKNRYEAQQLYNRLAMLNDKTLLFAVDESLRVQAIASSPEERQELVNSLVQMRQEGEKLIVVNAAALTRFLPERQFFDSLCFELHNGMIFDLKDLKERLVRSGYVKVNYVDRPGTFAARGGIVDIYPLDYDNPLRIEFFGDEIDSIRLFDVTSQRTILSVKSASISPASDLLFSPEQVETLHEKIDPLLEKSLAKLGEEQAEELEDAVKADLYAIETNDPLPHLYRYYAFLKPGSILDYTGGQIVLSSEEEVRRGYKQLVMDNTAYIQELVEDHQALSRYTMFHDLDKLLRNRDHMSIHEFVDYEKPVISSIQPVGDHHGIVSQWLAQEKDDPSIHLALDDEDWKTLSSRMDLAGFKRIEPVFYEGFVMPDLTVYTRRELFRQPVRHQAYQKTFKEGQVLENVLELEKGDYIVHAQYGIGQYLGIVTREVGERKADFLHVAYREGDDLYVPLSQFQLLRKFISKEGVAVRLSKLGSGEWEKTKARVEKKVEQIAERLVDLYAARQEDIGYAFPKDSALEEEFDEAFEYESTPDQIKATAEIKAEMEKPKPMDHLLCGDVGFGKTEVAMRCAFKAIVAGKQVAVLCPTTILSMQHFKTFQNRFESVGANIALVNRYTTTKKFKEICQDLKAGKIDIIIGTHRLFNKNIEYKDLGLLVVDEEQRFGVSHKERIKELNKSVDVLTLSATPIPRTLQMSLIGVRTISQLNTAPAQRHPIQTYVIEKKADIVKEIIQRELARDGQVFYLHNRVEDIFRVSANLQKEFPDISIGVAHGRMSKEEIENVMVDFAQGKYRILVCTTIIETGLDIANANTIIIEGADHFGLSQLYQIRGRVGRRDKLAYCYLMVPRQKSLTEQASKRLKSIKEFTQLGSGYKIAMRDLTIRGAGDMLGAKQAGFIDQVGLDMYLELLSNAIARKKGLPIKEPETEKTTNIALSGYVPDGFSDNDGDKLALYQEIKKAKTLRELDQTKRKIKDLFGTIPKEVQSIFEQQQISIYANMPGVANLEEASGRIRVTMEHDWSDSADGLKLFQAISEISPQIRLAYKNKQIQMEYPKKNNFYVLLDQIMSVVSNPAFRKKKHATG